MTTLNSGLLPKGNLFTDTAWRSIPANPLSRVDDGAFSPMSALRRHLPGEEAEVHLLRAEDEMASRVAKIARASSVDRPPSGGHRRLISELAFHHETAEGNNAGEEHPQPFDDRPVLLVAHHQ